MKYMLMLFLTGLVQASNVETYQFENPAQEATYLSLVAELRCLVCQNQNIADSNAELAQDMRRKTYELVLQGQSKGEIADFMAERYGDFVLYKPPFKAETALLWIAPFAILALGVWLLLSAIRAQKQRNPAHQPNEQALQKAADLLASSKRKTS